MSTPAIARTIIYVDTQVNRPNGKALLVEVKHAIVAAALVETAMYEKLTGEQVATRVLTVKYGMKVISKCDMTHAQCTIEPK